MLHLIVFCWFYFPTCGKFVLHNSEDESQESRERDEDFLKFWREWDFPMPYNKKWSHICVSMLKQVIVTKIFLQSYSQWMGIAEKHTNSMNTAFTKQLN